MPNLDEPRTTVQTLKILRNEGGWPLTLLKFISTKSFVMTLLNKTPNPVKALSTILADPAEVKPGNKKSWTQMYEEWWERQQVRQEQRAEIPEEFGEIDDRFCKVKVDGIEDFAKEIEDADEFSDIAAFHNAPDGRADLED